MNKLLCKLTGGHRYKAATQKIIITNGLAYISNICDRCGDKTVAIIPEKNFYPMGYREILDKGTEKE